jgi:nitroimidazol reductase NimA-like FMN-containing flavoprotein (pyridoxamine 5'-phosphate oxidase superfamily)
MPLPTTGLEVLDRAECMQLLASTNLGRVILSVGALPAAFPVNYRVRGAAIIFRTGPGTKVTRALDSNVVGFEVDSVDARTGAGWSVLVIGSATIVSDPDEIDALEQWGIPSLAGDQLPLFVRISVDQVSGRRIPASSV